MIKSRGGKLDLERTGRRKSLSAGRGGSSVSKKASERILTRNLRRSFGGERSRPINRVNDVENVRKRKKKLAYSPELPVKTTVDGKKEARKSLQNVKPKRKSGNEFFIQRRKRRRILEDSDDGFEVKSNSDKDDALGSLKDAKSSDSDSPECETDVDSEQKADSYGVNSKTSIRNQFLMQKLKRESSIRTTTQKYETERTDYIKEDRPSYIESTKPKEYVCYDTVTSNENFPKAENESVSKSLASIDGDEMKAESPNSQTNIGMKSTRSRNDSSHRSMINFQVGGRLEARDYLNMWYPSRIIQVDLESREILIHFERWNSRFDEWVSMDSPRLRPISRISTRKDNKARRPSLPKEFKIGEIVYAKWTDCKMYPAKILKVNPDETYTVLFYDGFERDVQFINVKKLPPELVGKINFKPGAMTKPPEEKHRRLSGSKLVEVSHSVEPGSADEIETPCVEYQSKVKDVSSSVGLSSSKVTPGIAPNKRNKLLVGGIFQAKRQHLKVKIGGGVITKQRKQSLGKSSSGRSTPTSGLLKFEDVPMDKDVKSVAEEKPKSKGSISSPLLVQELSKAPMYEPLASVGVPTKAFLIEEDHNHFKCTIPGCGKSFRKDVLLASHMKHYHATPKATASVKKSSIISEIKDEVNENTGVVLLETTVGTPLSDLTTPTSVNAASATVEGNLERKMITEKRRQLLMQRKLDSMTKKKEQHISDVIASVAKKFIQSTPEKPISDVVIKEVTPKIEKPKTSPKKRRYFFTSKVMSKFRRMKMVAGGQTGKITNGRRIAALEGGPQEELINCCCERPEEDGLMMQCEVCLAWQHGPCFGIEDEKKVPEKYICHACKNPKGLRSSFRYCYNQDWFKVGEMAFFKFLPARDTWAFRNSVYKTHGFTAQTLIASDVLHSLRYKLQIAKNLSHRELKRWSRPWDDKIIESSLSDAEGNDEKSTGGLWGFSDHCYSVPNQEFSNESLVDQNGLFFNEGSKGLCFEVAANEEVLDVDDTSQTGETEPISEEKRVIDSTKNLEKDESASCENNSIETSVNSKDDNNLRYTGNDAMIKSEPLTTKASVERTCLSAGCERQLEKASNEDIKYSRKDLDGIENDPVNWQLNLLDHVEHVQLGIDARLDEISKRLEVLEKHYDYSDVNFSKESHTEMPRAKRLLNCVINDLMKVRRMALYR